MVFKHYILTRMNLNIYRRKDAAEWMKHRMGLFDRYLVPSIQRQTCQNFTWVLCFDERTPDSLICKYDYMDRVEIAFESPMTWIKTITPECNWLITSRIDNDDFYLPKFVERIQTEFKPGNMLIDIDYYAMDGRRGKGEVYTSARTECTSPFMTLVERWENPIGVYAHPHDKICKYFKQQRKLIDVLAVQICHERCAINRIRGKLLPQIRVT